LKLSLTFSIQDYLKSIYELTAVGGAASTNALAKRLRVSPASVTGMVQKLASHKPALVVYRKHRGVTLTPRGTRAALEVIRHHRLLEAWLVQSLGYSWDEVHGDAERLEHAMSDSLEQHVAAALGDPDRDPHGEPIPSARLVMPVDRSVALTSLTAGTEAVVRRVRSDDSAVLRQLKGLGIVIGARLTSMEEPGRDGVMRLRVGKGKQVVPLGPTVTRRVYVQPVRKSKKMGLGKAK
jgi:DtxR family Mn-dependent transcriptional regulator